jgi:hypothetical protein
LAFLHAAGRPGGDCMNTVPLFPVPAPTRARPLGYGP